MFAVYVDFENVAFRAGNDEGRGWNGRILVRFAPIPGTGRRVRRTA